MGVNVSQKQVAEWEKKYGVDNVKKMTVHGSNGEEWNMYFILPQVHPKRRMLYSRALTFVSNNQRLEAGELILSECLLQGDEVFSDNNHLAYISAAIDLGKHIGLLETSTTSISTKSTEATQK